MDSVVNNAYVGQRKISWMEIYTGEKSTNVYGDDVWLLDETLAAAKDYVVSIEGSLTTPVGVGICSFYQCCVTSAVRLVCMFAACAL